MSEAIVFNSNEDIEVKINPDYAVKKIIDKLDNITDSLLEGDIPDCFYNESRFYYDKNDIMLLDNVSVMSDNEIERLKKYIDTNLSHNSMYGRSSLSSDKCEGPLLVSKDKRFIVRINHKLTKENDYEEYINKNKGNKLFSTVFFVAEFNKEDLIIDRDIRYSEQKDKINLLNNMSTLADRISRESSNYPYKSNEQTYNDFINHTNSCTNYILFNKYPYLGKKVMDKETFKRVERVFKDKDDKPISLDTGLLFKCDECKTFKTAETIKVLCVCNITTGRGTYLRTNFGNSSDITKDKLDLELESISRSSFECEYFSITCGNCGHEYDVLNGNIVDIKTPVNLIRSNNVFDIDTEKITISTIFNKVKGFANSYNITSINERIVFNLETGRTYALPTYILGSGKRLNNLNQIAPFSNTQNRPLIVKISLNDFYNIGKGMEKYFKNNLDNSKYVISFKDYIISICDNDPHPLNDIKRFFNQLAVEGCKDFNIANFFKEKEENKISLLSKIKLDSLESRRLLNVLVAYNQNPYVYFNKYMAFCKLSTNYYDFRFNNGCVKVFSNKEKKLRNPNIEKIILNKLKIKSKSEKKFLNEVIYSNMASSPYNALLLRGLKQVFKDKNALNKMIKIQNRVNHYNVSLVDNPYIRELIKRHGETAVANALTKAEGEGDTKLYLNFTYYYDTIANYSKLISAIPDYKLPNKRLRLEDLHNKIASDANKIKQTLVVYDYDENFLERFDNKVIDNVTFKVATSNHELTQIGSEMNICVGGYNYRVENGSLFIVSMRKDNKYVGCLEISRTANICQAKYIRNGYIKDHDDLYTALIAYAQIANLGFDTRDVKEEYMHHQEFKLDLNNLDKLGNISFKKKFPKIEIVDGEIIYDIENAESILVENNRRHEPPFNPPVAIQRPAIVDVEPGFNDLDIF